MPSYSIITEFAIFTRKVTAFKFVAMAEYIFGNCHHVKQLDILDEDFSQYVKSFVKVTGYLNSVDIVLLTIPSKTFHNNSDTVLYLHRYHKRVYHIGKINSDFFFPTLYKIWQIVKFKEKAKTKHEYFICLSSSQKEF